MDEKYPWVKEKLGRVDMGITNMSLDRDFNMTVCLHIRTPRKQANLQCTTMQMREYIDSALEQAMRAIFSIPGVRLLARVPSVPTLAAPVNAVLKPIEGVIRQAKNPRSRGSKALDKALDTAINPLEKPLKTLVLSAVIAGR